uniref:hypothetical protein n=1 Tax=Candidatus Limivicinus sp. TaxID=3030905 RepID=UPI003FF07867
RLKRKIKAWKILLSSHLIKYLISKITNRLEKYFDELIIDEIQDVICALLLLHESNPPAAGLRFSFYFFNSF